MVFRNFELCYNNRVSSACYASLFMVNLISKTYKTLPKILHQNTREPFERSLWPYEPLQILYKQDANFLGSGFPAITQDLGCKFGL